METVPDSAAKRGSAPLVLGSLELMVLIAASVSSFLPTRGGIHQP
jgi:hypothetical protein